MREGTGRPGLLQVSRSRSLPLVYHPISLPSGACAGTTRRRPPLEGHQQRGAQGVCYRYAVACTACVGELPMCYRTRMCSINTYAGLTCRRYLGKVVEGGAGCCPSQQSFKRGTGGVGSGCGGSEDGGHAIDDGASRSSSGGDQNPLPSSSERACQRCSAIRTPFNTKLELY